MFKRIKLPGFMVWFIKKRYFLDSLEEYLAGKELGRQEAEVGLYHYLKSKFKL